MSNLSPEIFLREANIHDKEILEYWDTKPHVIVSDPGNENWEYELARTPSWREQFIAMLGSRPIGFIQIIDPALEESHYWGKVGNGLRAIDIWIGEEDDLGKGYGTIMMDLALTHCFIHHNACGVLLDPLDSNKRAIKFYKKLGFSFVKNEWFGNDYCTVYRLNKDDWVA